MIAPAPDGAALWPFAGRWRDRRPASGEYVTIETTEAQGWPVLLVSFVTFK
jgi:hypothetical protein